MPEQSVHSRKPVVLRDHPGYRISFHTSGGSARILLISFGAVNSMISTRGWGVDFAAKHGYDNIYVSQRTLSQYQDLPLQDFQETVTPYAARYDRVVTYGASLGGYCAIYYGGSIDAQIIAISPHNSAHPLIRRGRFSLLPFAHREIMENPTSSRPPVIAYDPTLPDDQAFIDYLIRPAYPELQLEPYPHGAHTLLSTMKMDGVLNDFVLPLIEGRKSRRVQLRQQGSFVWHGEYGRDLMQQNQFEAAETHLRTSITLELNKHAARSLARVYARTGRQNQRDELNNWLEEQRQRQQMEPQPWLPLRERRFLDLPETAFQAGTYRPGEPPEDTTAPGQRMRLARQPGYRLTYHRAETPSRSLVLGFGRAAVGLKDSGLGRSFTREHGLDYVYVAQREGSDYQELSLESFRAALAPILERYDHILALGVGLGGYAALYYGGSVGARAVALNPFLRCHPGLGQPRGGPYLHKSLSEVDPPAGQPLVVWDPARTRQESFLHRVVKPAFPKAGCYRLKTSSPNAYRPLQEAGMLGDLLLGQLAGSPLPESLWLEGKVRP